MTMSSMQITGILVVFGLIATSLPAAEPYTPPSGSQTNAVNRLDVILKRIRNETLNKYQDTDILGVERNDSKNQPSVTTTVCITPYSCLACGCCGAGDVSSTFSDDDLQCLAAIDSLTSLTIHRSQLTNDGLRHLKSLTKLEKLDLSENAINDEGLKHLAGLTNLQVLGLEKTQITGVGLPHLAQLQKLRGLNLSHSQLTGNGLANLPVLSSLESFLAAETKIDNNGMTAFLRTPKLTSLYLGNTLVDDIGLSCIAGLTNLNHLHLNATKVNDAGLIPLGKLTNLQFLGLDHTNVQGEGLLHLGTLTNLKDLSVSCHHRFPPYSPNLIAVLGHLEKLRSPLVLDVSWPNSLPFVQRQVDIHGMKSIDWVTLWCMDDTEAIHFHDLPKIDSIDIGDLTSSERNKHPVTAGPIHYPQIGEIRIEGCKSLNSLNILLPNRLVIPGLESVSHLGLRGVIKPESLMVFRNVILKGSLSINAFPGSVPSSLAIFANKYGHNDNNSCRQLQISMDTYDMEWQKQLQAIDCLLEGIHVSASQMDGDSCLSEIAKLVNLHSLKIFDVSNLNPEAIASFRKKRPNLYFIYSVPAAKGQNSSKNLLKKN